MVVEPLPAGYLEAGREYLESLKRLGFAPEGLLWAWDKVIEQFVLILITTQVDFAGPLAINEALFKAYNASITPKEISPFIIRLHSEGQAIVEEIKNLQPARIGEKYPAKGWSRAPDGSRRQEFDVVNMHFDMREIFFSTDWVYLLGTRKPDPVTRNKTWRRFTDNIEKFAA